MSTRKNSSRIVLHPGQECIEKPIVLVPSSDVILSKDQICVESITSLTKEKALILYKQRLYPIINKLRNAKYEGKKAAAMNGIEFNEDEYRWWFPTDEYSRLIRVDGKHDLKKEHKVATLAHYLDFTNDEFKALRGQTMRTWISPKSFKTQLMFVKDVYGNNKHDNNRITWLMFDENVAPKINVKTQVNGEKVAPLWLDEGISKIAAVSVHPDTAAHMESDEESSDSSAVNMKMDESSKSDAPPQYTDYTPRAGRRAGSRNRLQKICFPDGHVAEIPTNYVCITKNESTKKNKMEQQILNEHQLQHKQHQQHQREEIHLQQHQLQQDQHQLQLQQQQHQQEEIHLQQHQVQHEQHMQQHQVQHEQHQQQLKQQKHQQEEIHLQQHQLQHEQHQLQLQQQKHRQEEIHLQQHQLQHTQHQLHLQQQDELHQQQHQQQHHATCMYKAVKFTLKKFFGVGQNEQGKRRRDDNRIMLYAVLVLVIFGMNSNTVPAGVHLSSLFNSLEITSHVRTRANQIAKAMSDNYSEDEDVLSFENFGQRFFEKVKRKDRSDIVRNYSQPFITEYCHDDDNSHHPDNNNKRDVLIINTI